MWPFSSSKNAKVHAIAGFSSVMVDMHSHLLPGIDDGSPDIATSIALVKDLQALGFKKLITTPHIMSDFYKNTPDGILNKVAVLKNALAAENIDIEIQAAAEYYVDEGFLNLVEKNEILTFGDSMVLMEFSYINPPENLNSIIFQIESNGYKPILAHPERYNYWHGKIDKFKELKDRGVLLQTNTNSFGGYYGAGAQKTAIQLANKMMIDFIGSDTHNQRHLVRLKTSLQNKTLQELIHSQVLKNRLL